MARFLSIGYVKRTENQELALFGHPTLCGASPHTRIDTILLKAYDIRVIDLGPRPTRIATIARGAS